jgi:hypothetical protein
MNNIDVQLDDEIHVDQNDTTEDEPEEGNKISLELFYSHLRQ